MRAADKVLDLETEVNWITSMDSNILNCSHKSSAISLLKRHSASYGSFFSHIEKADFSNCNLSDEDLKDIEPFLESLPKLKELDLAHNNITNEGVFTLMIQVSSIFRNIESISLRNNTSIGQEGVSYIALILGDAIQLTSIDLSGVNISSVVDKITVGIKEAANLKELRLENCSLSSDHVEKVVSSLMADDCLCRLRLLSLGQNLLTNFEAAEVFEPLLTHPYFRSLEELELRSAVSTDFKSYCVNQIFTENRKSNSIRSNFFDNHIFSSKRRSFKTQKRTFLEMVADCLARNTSLKRLCLSGNKMDDAHCVRFAKAIGHNQCLTSLELDQNQISETGGVSLLTALDLHENTKILRLSLNSNNICPNSCEVLNNLQSPLRERGIFIEI